MEAHNITVTGVLHVGAHNCEELREYRSLGLPSSAIVWIEAFPHKVDEAVARGVPNVYQAVITDKHNDIVHMNLANNVESSSVLPFGTHTKRHPTVKFVEQVELRTTTIDQFTIDNKIDISKLNFWCIDIQGAELMALRGAVNALQHVTMLYIEVNVDELYLGCGLLPEVDAYLEKRGLSRVAINMTNRGWGDALYVRRQAADTISA